jgi:uncharacterized protein DUF6624
MKWNLLIFSIIMTLCYGHINQELQSEIVAMKDEDQALRFAIFSKLQISDEEAATLFHMDEQHGYRLKQIVEKCGWPGISLVGELGSSAMWLLVQHQDKDVSFQQNCLELLKEAVQRREASFCDYTYLFDRVRKNQGLPQLYGTQVVQTGGKWRLYPVENVEELELRRKEAGLSSIEEYKKMLEQIYPGDWSDLK